MAVPSKWETYPCVMWSCQPWKWVRKRTTFRRPVAARATRSARWVASVPDEVNRTRSGGRHQLLDRLCPAHLPLVARPEVGPAAEGFDDDAVDVRVVVSEH